MKIQSNVLTVTGGPKAEISVTFDAPFAEIPTVILTILKLSEGVDETQNIGWSLSEPRVSKTGFTSSLGFTYNAPTGNSATIKWFALETEPLNPV